MQCLGPICLGPFCRCHHRAVSRTDLSMANLSSPQCSSYGQSFAVITVQCLGPIYLKPFCRCHRNAVSRADLPRAILSLSSQCSVYGRSVYSHSVVVITVHCLGPMRLGPICRCHHSAVSRADLSRAILSLSCCAL